MKKISAIVGIVLILAAVTLSIVSLKSGKAQLSVQKSIVTKYINLSTSDLANNNIQGALQNAKLAIQANPMDNAGFISYQNALKLKYQPNGQSSQPAAAPAPSSSSDDSMGC